MRDVTTNYYVQCHDPYHCGVICTEHAFPHVHTKDCDEPCDKGGRCIPCDPPKENKE